MPLVALFSWPILTAIFFSKMRPPIAVMVGLVGGYLLLPPAYGINLPILPTFDKYNVASLSALICALVVVGSLKDKPDLEGWIPRGFLVRTLLVCVIGGIIITTLTNGDGYVVGGRFVRPMTIYDGFSALLTAMTMLVPLLLGRKFLATPEAQRTALVILVLAGFAYSFLAIFEARMSPQLNRWIYGYFPHSWVQHIRGNGFRPVVFLAHGLWLSIFFTMAYMAALGCMRIFTGPKRVLFGAAALWLLLTIVLTKSLGALMISVILTPIILLLTARLQLIALGIFAVAVLVYPSLRAIDVVPVQQITEFAQTIDEKRAASFEFRIRNENKMINKAMERPLFGWGGNGRWFTFDDRGRSALIPDGYWAILFSRAGWAGYIGEFGLLTLPVLLVLLRARKMKLGPEAIAMSSILVANMLDLIPNASLTPLTWLVAGAVWGRVELGEVSATRQNSPENSPDPTPSGPRYSRRRPHSRQEAGPRAESAGTIPAYSRFQPSSRS